MTVQLTNGLCFHTEKGSVLLALGHDSFRIQVNDMIVATLPRECAEDMWSWLERNLFNERHIPNGYADRTETD